MKKAKKWLKISQGLEGFLVVLVLLISGLTVVRVLFYGQQLRVEREGRARGEGEQIQAEVKGWAKEPGTVGTENQVYKVECGLSSWPKKVCWDVVFTLTSWGGLVKKEERHRRCWLECESLVSQRSSGG